MHWRYVVDKIFFFEIWLLEYTQWRQWLNFPGKSRVLNYDQFLWKCKFKYPNTSAKSSWIKNLKFYKTKKSTKFVIFRPPSGFFPFQLLKKSCFTKIIVAKLSFRILNFLIPIPTKLLYFYFIWPLEFLVLRTLPWETRIQNFFVLLSRNMPDYGTIV